MSVGINIVGRGVTFTVGADNLLGVLSKGISFTNEMGDTTDDDAAGWKQFAAAPLLKSASFTVSGQLKNLESVGMFFNASNIFEVIITYPEGTTLTGDFALTSGPSLTHEHASNSTFEVSFESSGAVVYVAGV